MEGQILISIGREFGSAGHEIGETIAKRLGINFYDRAMLDELAQNYGIDKNTLEKYDEKRKVPFLSRTVRGYSNSLEDMVFEFQSKYILDKAQKGDSFVIVGRCGDMILKDKPGFVSLFILGDKEEKIARIKDIYKLNTDEAYEKMRRHDKKRKAYHNSRCSSKWGDSRTYDLCINSSKLGTEQTVDILMDYIEFRTKQTI